MLDTPKLLYVLPDVAYLAELLPTKKPHNFTIHAFRQINGQFMDENEFLSENVIKLFSKLEPENYHLILPDFLFTNTIISIPEATEAKVQQVLKSETLPGLELTAGTHEITTHILTQHKGQARV